MAVPAVLLPRASIEPLMLWVDGYGEESHEVSVRKTSYPLETGSSAIDHAVIEPERLTLEGWVSNVHPQSHADRGLPVYDRATAAWEALVVLARKRDPVTVVTLLGTYERMLVTKVSAPVSEKTGRGLRFTLALEQLRFAAAYGDDAPVSGLAVDRLGEVRRGRVQTTPVPAALAVKVLSP